MRLAQAGEGQGEEAGGAQRLAVAYVEEGAALRQAGVEVPIVVLAGFATGQVPVLAEHALTPVVSTPQTLEAVLAAAAPLPRVHVKVDTGMSRLGFTQAAVVEAALRLQSAGIEVEGVMTHLAAADEGADFTESDEHLRQGADVLAEEIPDAEHAVIEGADHGAHQSHPAELAALIRRAVARAAPRSPAP